MMNVAHTSDATVGAITTSGKYFVAGCHSQRGEREKTASGARQENAHSRAWGFGDCVAQ